MGSVDSVAEVIFFLLFCSLAGNRIGAEGAKAIAEALMENATVTSLE